MKLAACKYCNQQPGTKVGPPSLARCITAACIGTGMAAKTFDEWNSFNAEDSAAAVLNAGLLIEHGCEEGLAGRTAAQFQEKCATISRLTEDLESRLQAFVLARKMLAESEAERDRMRKALEFYADPFEWKKLHDPENDVQVPDFYCETSFGDTATEALTDADGAPNRG